MTRPTHEEMQRMQDDELRRKWRSAELEQWAGGVLQVLGGVAAFLAVAWMLGAFDRAEAQQVEQLAPITDRLGLTRNAMPATRLSIDCDTGKPGVTLAMIGQQMQPPGSVFVWSSARNETGTHRLEDDAAGPTCLMAHQYDGVGRWWSGWLCDDPLPAWVQPEDPLPIQWMVTHCTGAKTAQGQLVARAVCSGGGGQRQ